MNTVIDCSSCSQRYNFLASLICPQCGNVYTKHLEELQALRLKHDPARQDFVPERIQALVGQATPVRDYKSAAAGDV